MRFALVLPFFHPTDDPKECKEKQQNNKNNERTHFFKMNASNDFVARMDYSEIVRRKQTENMASLLNSSFMGMQIPRVVATNNIREHLSIPYPLSQWQKSQFLYERIIAAAGRKIDNQSYISIRPSNNSFAMPIINRQSESGFDIPHARSADFENSISSSPIHGHYPYSVDTNYCQDNKLLQTTPNGRPTMHSEKCSPILTMNAKGTKHPYTFLFDNTKTGAKRSHAELTNLCFTSERKKKAKIDIADMPRRPLTAYNFFFSEEREIILAQLSTQRSGSGPTNGIDSNTSNAPISKISSLEKNDNMDQKGGQDQLQLIEKSMRQLGPEEKEELHLKIKAKTAQILKMAREGDKEKKSHRKTHGKVSFKILAKIVGSRWHRLTATRKAYYDALAKADKERYEEHRHIFDSKNHLN